MINLLPNNRKTEIKASRTNTAILRYLVMSVAVVLVILSIFYIYKIALNVTKNSSEQTVANSTVEDSSYNETKQKIDTLNSRLSESKTILDSQISYSKILTNLGKLMPENTVLENISISTTALSSPVNITAYGKSVEDITNLQTAFQSSSLFSSVTFQTVNEADSTLPDYPVSVTVSAVFDKERLR